MSGPVAVQEHKSRSCCANAALGSLRQVKRFRSNGKLQLDQPVHAQRAKDSGYGRAALPIDHLATRWIGDCGLPLPDDSLAADTNFGRSHNAALP